MRFSSDVTISWSNGWSMEIRGSSFGVVFSIMGPRQVFYSLFRDNNPNSVVVRAEAEQEWNIADEARLLAVMAAMKNMPSNPMFNSCGMVVNQRVQHERIKNDDSTVVPLMLDDSDNQFNSMQS